MMFSIMTLSLMAQAGTADFRQMLGSPLVMMLVLMVIFYVLLIMPQQRRQKKIQDMLSALKNGDKVITNGGLYGTIVGIDEGSGSVQLRIADMPQGPVKIKILRSAVASLQPESKEES
jgi:preprotein translocase subunit YajC